MKNTLYSWWKYQPYLAINSKLKSVHYLLFRQQSFARRITTNRWYPSFPSFWLSWCGIGLLSVHNLCSVCFHNFSGFGIRGREGENIFPSINQSIYCLKLLFPEQTNSFVCDTYFSTMLDYIQYFFLYFFFNTGDLLYYSYRVMDIPSMILTTIREWKNFTSDLCCVFSSGSGR